MFKKVLSTDGNVKNIDAEVFEFVLVLTVIVIMFIYVIFATIFYRKCAVKVPAFGSGVCQL